VRRAHLKESETQRLRDGQRCDFAGKFHRDLSELQQNHLSDGMLSFLPL
jgi:hypothetical protein